MAAVFALLLAGCAGGDDRSETSAPERIVWASDRDGDFEIYSMSPDGTDVTQLTRNETTPETENDDWSPAWSTDGRLIAFTSTRDHKGDGLQSQELYVMNSDGTGQRRLTKSEENVLGGSWMPDGRIVFLRCADGLTSCELMAIDPKGGEPERLYRSKGGEVVSLTPDGKRLLIATFDSQAAEATPKIELANLDGSDRRLVIDDGGEPDWSGDGGRLVFTSTRDRNGPCLFTECTGFASELYAADEDGGDRLRLTRTEADEVNPRWSPDGKKLIFARIEDEERGYELFVMNADGTCERQLTDNEDWDWMADWVGPEDGEPLTC